MNILVVYYSKSGNTKKMAEVISETLKCNNFALNIMKRGRKSSVEKKLEELNFKNAINTSKESDLVFIGTPTEFRKPHVKVTEFINSIKPKNVALFCTYYGMIGATLIDMETICLHREINIIGITGICVGTEKYQFRRNISDYHEKITNKHIQQVKDFALECINNNKLIPLRFKGVCGKNCENCNLFQKDCKGASYNCWSGNKCEIFNCCVIKKSIKKCFNCSKLKYCEKISNKKLLSI